MSDLIEQIESYGFECEAGPLTMCVDWTNLKAELEAKDKRISGLIEELLNLEAVAKDRYCVMQGEMAALEDENERLHKDVNGLMTLLAREKADNERLRAVYKENDA